MPGRDWPRRGERVFEHNGPEAGVGRACPDGVDRAKGKQWYENFAGSPTGANLGTDG